MAESRTYTDGRLSRLVADNRDRDLDLSVESLRRKIPNAVASIQYSEFDTNGVQTFTATRTREQLLNTIDNHSFIFDYTYYQNGAIDTIRKRVYDNSIPPVKLSDITIKHYIDGRAPIIL